MSALKRTWEKPKRNGYGHGRFCRQTVAGDVDLPKLCLLNDECRHCAFDQWLDHLAVVAVRDSLCRCEGESAAMH